MRERKRTQHDVTAIGIDRGTAQKDPRTLRQVSTSIGEGEGEGEVNEVVVVVVVVVAVVVVKEEKEEDSALRV
jgi:hypothetical protein